MGGGNGEGKSNSFVYILHPEHAWHPATLEKMDKGKATVSIPIYPDEKSIVSDGGRGAKKREEKVIDLKGYPGGVLPLQNVDSNGDLLVFPDMVDLPYLHEAGILYNLKVRHMQGHPYTRTGDIIIAINPFQWFTELYTESVRTKYSNRCVWEDHGEEDPRRGLAPHVYETSSLCYKGLAFAGKDQSILVSGESGAGKTETVKIAMNHMASVQRGPVVPSTTGDDKFEDPVVNRVLQSNPLLESFGNAKTVRNDNSSRFGKYTQLQFDVSERNTNMIDRSKSTAKLAGSKCEAYLLEKNRITGHEGAERTYHIFYQIIAAPDAQKTGFWSKMAGTNFDSFKYVGKTDTLQIEKRTDAQWFEGTCETLALINLGGDKLNTLMRAIIAVMQCGNLTFSKLGGDADKSECTSKKELADLAELLGVGENDLNLAFTERTMKTRNEEYKVPLNPETAKDTADAFAKETYGKAFLWLVDGINEATSAETNYGKDVGEFGIIGLLDIFGFESFVINRFEQLCINYANEKLQQKFTEDIFRTVQDEYESEGIELAEITYDDNTDVLDLIEGRTGLCAMLNEECVRPKGSDEAFVQKALAQNKKSPCMIVNNMDRMSFGIHHYAGKVMYSAEFFVIRNQDTLPTDLEDLMFKSTNFIIAKKPEEPAAGKGPKRQKSNLVGSTIWTKYKTQLGELMGNLRKTQSRYIRCIKPNKAKVPVIMEHIGTVEQLRCAGVVAAVTITRSAFPNRLDNTVVRVRFNTMWDKTKYPTTRTDDDDLAVGIAKDCDACMTSALKEKEKDGKKAFVVGKTRTYFRSGALEFLEANRSAGMDVQAKQIQALVRGHLARKKFGNMVGQKEAEARKAREEEARKKKEAEEAKKKAERDKLAAEQAEIARKRAEQEKKEREERERKEAAERKKREKEEAERKEAEEKARLKELKKAQKEVEKKKEELDKKKKENEKKVAKAEAKFKEVNKEREEYLQKYEKQMKEAANIDTSELQNLQKKVAESEKILSYLKKENEKFREKTKDMEADIEELKETNQRLVEASASAGASLDSLNKQKARIADHNAKLEDNLGKYKDQNKQLKKDLDNRQAYFEAEKRIKEDYEKAMEKIVEMMEDKCDDSALVEKIMTAQLTCTTNNLNRIAGGAFKI